MSLNKWGIMLTVLLTTMTNISYGVELSMQDQRKMGLYFNQDAVNLYKTISQGNLEKARTLVMEGTPLESKGPQTDNLNVQQITLLSYALNMNDKETAKGLIQLGSNPLFRPSVRPGNTFTYLISNGNSDALDYLYKLWPLSKIDKDEQKLHAFYAIDNQCISCLRVMFKEGLSPDIVDIRGYNLFMKALSQEDLDTAWWLLSEGGVSLKAQAVNGFNPANMVQFFSFKYPRQTINYQKVIKMKNFIETNSNIRFPVETSLQILRKKEEENNLKKKNLEKSSS